MIAADSGIITAADIQWELEPGPWPTPPETPFEDPIERIADLAIERDRYRELAQQLLHALHHVMLERDVLREQRRLDFRRQRGEA